MVFQLERSVALIKQEKARSVAESTSLCWMAFWFDPGLCTGPTRVMYWDGLFPVNDFTYSATYCSSDAGFILYCLTEVQFQNFWWKLGRNFFFSFSLFPLSIVRVHNFFFPCAWETKYCFHSHYYRTTLGKIFVYVPLRPLDSEVLVQQMFTDSWAIFVSHEPMGIFLVMVEGGKTVFFK